LFKDERTGIEGALGAIFPMSALTKRMQGEAGRSRKICAEQNRLLMLGTVKSKKLEREGFAMLGF